MSIDSPTWESAVDSFLYETTTETVTRVISLPLETSDRKTERVRECIDEWQTIARRAAELMPSFPAGRWGIRDTQQTRLINREFPDRSLLYNSAAEAVFKPSVAYAAWRESDDSGDRPLGKFGDAPYMQVANREIKIAENERGYGLRVGLEPHKPEWFHIKVADYHVDWLDRLCDPDDSARHGSTQIRLTDDGESLVAHVPVTVDVEVIAPHDVERWLGVDIGCGRTIFAAALVDAQTGDVDRVEVESAKEYIHHRSRYRRKFDRLSSKGDLQALRECSGDLENYTDHVFHSATREIVDMAEEAGACGIRLEEITGIQDRLEETVDWPFAKFAEYLCYKATAAGIPVDRGMFPWSTQGCNRCHERGETAEHHFYCPACDYQVHRDVNAALNIARKAPIDLEKQSPEGGRT